MKNTFFLFTFIILQVFALQAQKLYVCTTNNIQNAYLLSEIREITFANRHMYIGSTDTALVRIPLVNIQFLSFKDYGGVSIAENTDLTAVKLYPNPSADYLILQWENSTTESKYELYDMYGKMLQQSDIQENNTIISIAELPPAIYVLKIIVADKEVKSLKIIKN